MIQRVPYEVMAYQVELLYQKEFPQNDPAITLHCEFIAEFIRSCGWTEDEYFDRWIGEEERAHPLLPERNLNLS